VKIGDLVTVKPARVHLYLIVGCHPDKEMNWPDSSGINAGMLWDLHGTEEPHVPMYEKFIEVINEAK
jgi:hypothetical protein